MKKQTTRVTVTVTVPADLTPEQVRERLEAFQVRGGGRIYSPERLDEAREDGMRASYNLAEEEARRLLTDQALARIRGDYEG